MLSSTLSSYLTIIFTGTKMDALIGLSFVAAYVGFFYCTIALYEKG
jgi:hypothetical protein